MASRRPPTRTDEAGSGQPLSHSRGDETLSPYISPRPFKPGEPGHTPSSLHPHPTPSLFSSQTLRHPPHFFDHSTRGRPKFPALVKVRKKDSQWPSPPPSPYKAPSTPGVSL